jgi:hypothetical protein
MGANEKLSPQGKSLSTPTEGVDTAWINTKMSIVAIILKAS